jgi:lactam utilization protein B
MDRKAQVAAGHAAGDHATRPFDQPLADDDREAGARPSYVEAVLFGRRRALASAEVPGHGPFKPRPRMSRKGTPPCAS